MYHHLDPSSQLQGQGGGGSSSATAGAPGSSSRQQGGGFPPGANGRQADGKLAGQQAASAPGATSIALVTVATGGSSGGAPAGYHRNPLLCSICNSSYKNPCLLACYHTFCASCLRGRANNEGKLPCPLCG